MKHRKEEDNAGFSSGGQPAAEQPAADESAAAGGSEAAATEKGDGLQHKKYPCGIEAVSEGPDPLPDNCPEHGADCAPGVRERVMRVCEGAFIAMPAHYIAAQGMVVPAIVLRLHSSNPETKNDLADLFVMMNGGRFTSFIAQARERDDSGKTVGSWHPAHE